MATNKNTSFLIVLLCNFLMFACKKNELPKESVGSVSYYFNGSVNNVNTYLAAGKEDYYMYTSFNKDVFDLYSFMGDLKKVNCSTCENSLKIKLNDYRTSSGSKTLPDSSIYKGYYAFATPSGKASHYKVNFIQNALGGVVSSYLWDFGDGSSSTLPNPSHEYVRLGTYEVCLTVNFTNSCSSSICNTIVLGASDNTCEANFTASLPSGNTITFTANPIGTAPFTYQWDFGDGNNSTIASPAHIYAFTGTYTASLRVTDAAGYTAIKRINVRTQGSTDCFVQYSFLKSAIANPSNLGNVEIEWIDMQGKKFTSYHNNQHDESWFSINNVVEGNVNELGSPVKKTQLSFSTWLYNGSDSIQINSKDAVLGIAYPN